MDYKIVSANAELGQIQVTYSSENIDIGTYAIDVPVVNGAFITGEILDAEIRVRAPTWLIERKKEVATALGFEEINSLVQAPTVQESVLPAQTVSTGTEHLTVIESRLVEPTFVSNPAPAEVL